MLTYTPTKFRNFAEQVILEGEAIESRLGKCYEIIGAQFEVCPEAGFYFPPQLSRKFNMGFAVTELFSLLTGMDSVGLFTKHIKSYGQFSTDGHRLDNSYGSRNQTELQHDGRIIHTVLSGSSQLEMAVDLLRKDRNSRQAVVTINSGFVDMMSHSQHVPCTLSLQFLIRNDKLDMVVTMRSNDVFRGISTDVFVFGMIQQIMASTLQVGVGRYVTNAGSLHVYDNDLEAIRSVDDYDGWETVPIVRCTLNRAIEIGVTWLSEGFAPRNGKEQGLLQDYCDVSDYRFYQAYIDDECPNALKDFTKRFVKHV